MKLSSKQKEVIRLMREGWEFWTNKRNLNSGTPLPDGYRLQKNGYGKGGEVKKVYQRTVHSLVRLKLITPFEPKISRLTELGKTIEL